MQASRCAGSGSGEANLVLFDFLIFKSIILLAYKQCFLFAFCEALPPRGGGGYREHEVVVYFGTRESFSSWCPLPNSVHSLKLRMLGLMKLGAACSVLIMCFGPLNSVPLLGNRLGSI